MEGLEEEDWSCGVIDRVSTSLVGGVSVSLDGGVAIVKIGEDNLELGGFWGN